MTRRSLSLSSVSQARAATLKTLVLSVGDTWWKEYLYPSVLAKCHADGVNGPLRTSADGYLPLTGKDVAVSRQGIP